MGIFLQTWRGRKRSAASQTRSLHPRYPRRVAPSWAFLAAAQRARLPSPWCSELHPSGGGSVQRAEVRSAQPSLVCAPFPRHLRPSGLCCEDLLFNPACICRQDAVSWTIISRNLSSRTNNLQVLLFILHLIWLSADHQWTASDIPAHPTCI